MHAPSLVLLLASTAAGFLLPAPGGKHNVSLATGPLVDYSRNDPGAATPTPRALMLSVFQPVSCAATRAVPYMPNKTAEFQGPYVEKEYDVPRNISKLFLAARLPVCAAEASGGCVPVDDAPILLLSPGYGISRLYYSVLASAIASEGFMVITMDHPNDTNIITYPDGHSVESGVDPDSTTYAGFEAHVGPRAADASFVIDQLSNATAMKQLLPHRGPRPFPTDRVAMLGHSLGGTASIAAASKDPRVRAAVDWDGSLFGSLPPAGVSQPVLFMASVHPNDPSWEMAWPHLNGPKLWLEVANSTHFSYSDAPTLLEASGQDPASLAKLLGTIAPTEMVRIMTAYTTEWMRGAFAGKEGGKLLEGNEPSKYPEVSTIMKANF